MATDTTVSTDQNAINFDSVASLRKTIDNMQLAENVRAQDRALIDTLANGERPYTPAEVEKHQIRYNINWGELKTLVSAANRQINGALVFKPLLFTATSLGGDVEKRDEYGQKFTAKINPRLQRGKNGKTHTYVLLARTASVCLHAIGVLYFPNYYCVLPKFASLENVLIPTDTDVDFSNLSYFDIRVELSICELNDMVSGDRVDEHWNVDEVNKIIQGLKDFNGLNTNNYNWQENPEKWQEIFKQNKAFLNSDAVAKVKLDYFFSKEGVDNKWFLKVFMREPVGEADPDAFLYQSDKPFADDIGQILQVQYADTSLVPPLKYHSQRGLGASLYSPAWALNMFRSGLFQHGEESLRMYLRVTNGADKGRENVVNLQQYGILEDGVSFVPEAERHQVDANLIESIMSQCRQNLAENSASFVQDINDGTSKEMTLGEAQIRQQSVNVAVSSMLRMMYCLDTYYYEEVVRRYLLPNQPEGSEQHSFRNECIADGIPEELLVPSNWRISPEQVLGAGDQSLALQEAGALFNVRQSFDPKSQRIIDRMFVSTVTRDPAKGMLIVPDVKDNASSGTQAAEDVFGTLMKGVPVSLRQGIPQNDYIETMLKMAGEVIQRITQGDNTGTMEDVIGLATVLQDVQNHIQILAADKKQAQNVKMYGDALGKLGNLVKAFGQRIQASGATKTTPKLIESISYKDVPDDVKRQLEAQAGLQPSQMPVPDPKAQKADQALIIKAANHQQKTQQLNENFVAEQQRENLRTHAEIQRDSATHAVKLTAELAKVFLKQAAGNKDLARQNARKEGYEF